MELTKTMVGLRQPRGLRMTASEERLTTPVQIGLPFTFLVVP
jgi:hypothetical protein